MIPRVSVLIPVYNRESLIGTCLESVLAQSLGDLEVIVCDNCSTDATWDVLRDYGTRDSRVRVFRNDENLGPVRNWARCAEEARTPYSKLLFSDDLIAPSYLERTLPLIKSPGVGSVFTASEVGETPGSSRRHFSFPGSPGPWEPGRFLLGHVFAYDLPFSPSSALLHTSDLRENLAATFPANLNKEFMRTGAGPDLLLFLGAEYRHGCVAHVPESLAFFRSHPDSISVREVGNIFSLYRRAISWFLARNNPSLLGCYFSGIRWLIGGDKGKAEVLKIIQDLNLTDASVPRGLGYMMDMSRRLGRSFQRRRPVQPFAWNSQHVVRRPG